MESKSGLPDEFQSDSDLDKVELEPEWYINGYVAKGTLNIIASESGIGKSYLLVMMAYTIASGGNWFDKFVVPRPAKVAYFLGDGSKQDTRERAEGPGLLGMREKVNDPQTLFFAFNRMPNLIEPKVGKRPHVTHAILKELIEDMGIEVICIDSLSSALGGSNISNPDAASLFYENMTWFRREWPHVTWLILHHTKKPSYTNTGERIQDSDPMLGATQVKAAIDNLWLLEQVKHPNAGPPTLQVRQGKARSSLLRWKDDWFIEFDEDTLLIAPQGHRASHGEREFKTWASVQPGDFSTRDAVVWAEGHGVARGTVEDWLTLATKEGWLERPRRGVYRYTRNRVAGKPQLDKSG